MEKKINSNYARSNSEQEQLLSYFESHIDKYPDGPKPQSQKDVTDPRDYNYGQDDYSETENVDETDEDFEEGYRLWSSNKDDFSENYDRF
ncbi:hypothetical protein [Flavobacterium sp.]